MGLTSNGSCRMGFALRTLSLTSECQVMGRRWCVLVLRSPGQDWLLVFGVLAAHVGVTGTSSSCTKAEEDERPQQCDEAGGGSSSKAGLSSMNFPVVLWGSSCLVLPLPKLLGVDHSPLCLGGHVSNSSTPNGRFSQQDLAASWRCCSPSLLTFFS